MIRTVKKIVDVILLLLFLMLLGYSFTGGQLHEILGLGFLLLVVVHNLLNRKYYSTLRKGTYSPKRKLSVIVNTALLADAAVMGATGIINSRYLLNTGIQISNIGQIHKISSLIGLVLILYHLFLHAFSHGKTKYKKSKVVLVALPVVIAAALGLFGLPYLRRHFKTVHINLKEAVSGEQVAFEDRTVLTVYFTRIGNSDFEDDIDAVSGASLMLTEEDELMGNSQVIADMLHDAAGGELISINVKNKYPSSYSDTVSVAGKEKDSDELPELVDMPENIKEYDTVLLVYPLWWWSIPKPVEAFLKGYDFSDKTVLPIVTHGGSKAGNSVKEIQSICSGKVIDTPLEVYCDDVPYCREDVTEWLKKMRNILK